MIPKHVPDLGPEPSLEEMLRHISLSRRRNALAREKVEDLFLRWRDVFKEKREEGDEGFKVVICLDDSLETHFFYPESGQEGMASLSAHLKRRGDCLCCVTVLDGVFNWTKKPKGREDEVDDHDCLTFVLQSPGFNQIRTFPYEKNKDGTLDWDAGIENPLDGRSTPDPPLTCFTEE